MENTNNVQRSEMWEQIYNIVKQIPRKEVQGDAMDAPSAATEIENYFLKTCNTQFVNNNENIERVSSLIALIGDIKCNIEQYGYLTTDVMARIDDAINGC